MAPLISVIVPVYKAEDTLRNCVDSILKQTNRDFELLLIDDGSPDRCREICDTYAAKDARVRVWHKENGGVSTARNLGLEVACGEWIAFVDADDSVDEGFFDVLKEGLGYDLVIGGYKTLPKGEIYYNFEGDFKDDTMGDFVARHLWNGYVWGKFYKTSILREHRIMFRTDLVVYEDLLFNLDYILQCNSIKLVPSCLYLYMDPPGKMIQEKYALLPDEIRKIYALVDDRLERLAHKFHCWRPAFIFDFIEHYPLERILRQGSDDELYHLYVEVKGNVDRSVFYNDRIASPILRFISCIKKEYIVRRHRVRGRLLAKALSSLYGRELLRVKYSSFSKKFQAILITYRLFGLLDVYFAIRSLVNRFRKG